MKIKNIIVSVICSLLIILAFIYNEQITGLIEPLLENTKELSVEQTNEYTKTNGYKYVNLNTSYIPYGYQDLLDIIFSVLNNGWEQFTFYCPNEYESCLNDVEAIVSDNTLLTNINNYVHPFNSFENIRTTYNSYGEVTISIEKLYTKEEITIINEKADEIMASVVNDEETIEEKIKAIHDYIIDHTEYDTVKINAGISNYKSNIAYGPLIEGYSVCGGYSDSMAIFLNRLGINNYKIASKNHVWNAVNLNDKWYHLDLTWDDPISTDGTKFKLIKFFLIDNTALKNEDTDENHIFNPSVYLEFK